MFNRKPDCELLMSNIKEKLDYITENVDELQKIIYKGNDSILNKMSEYQKDMSTVASALAANKDDLDSHSQRITELETLARFSEKRQQTFEKLIWVLIPALLAVIVPLSVNLFMSRNITEINYDTIETGQNKK